MFARTTTVMGTPDKIDAGIEFVRDTVMPTVMEMAGCTGVSLLCDRDSGRCIATTAWTDEMAMHESEPLVHSLRARAAETFGGKAEVAEWEIALMHRRHEAHHGACARVLWGTVDPDRMDDNLATMRMAMLPRMDDLPGFCSTSAMINRDLGRIVVTVVYDSKEDMARALEQAQALRADMVQATGTEITEIAEFDLALSHLRVPETV